MTTQDVVVSTPSRPPPLRRWTRRIVPLVFAVVLVGAGILTLEHSGRRSHPGGVSSAGRFSHTYPADPVVPERPKVRSHSPKAPRANLVNSAGTIHSFAKLAARLPKGVLRRVGPNAWLLSRPAGVEERATLDVHGPATLRIGPGAFLQATNAGTVRLTHVTVVGVGASGRPLTTAARARGFLVATSGGRLVLVGDTISDLGHLGTQAYGVSMQKPGRGSKVIGCRIDRNYFGVYLTHALGVRIAGNHVSRSIVYGIDPHTESSGIQIVHNRVTNSGVHGIILATRVRNSRIAHNVVEGATLHGIVVFDNSTGNVVQDNRVSRTFDGIVVTDSSKNTIEGNTVDMVRRFGLRLSGLSRANVVRDNLFAHALLGLYVYKGASGNSLLSNRFRADRENLRIRSDSKRNRVSPVPPRSELR